MEWPRSIDVAGWKRLRREWKDGGPWNGQGKLTYKNGDVYEGEWKDGERHGQGKLTYKNGVVYKGAFVDGNVMAKEN